MSANGTSHNWRFFMAGGFHQVQLHSGADIASLAQLDQKLWLALACPVKGLEFDQKTLELIDTDKDGRIRAPEIIAAANWACASLKNADDLLRGSDALPLGAISDATPEGKQLLASARQILMNLGKADSTSITIEDAADTARIFAQTQFNGDGIVPADSAPEDATKAVIENMIECMGAETDRSGKPGINQAKADQFYAELQAFADWFNKSESDAATLLPLGDSTAGAVAALNAVKGKVDDFFARCRLAAYDSRALGAMNRQEAEYAAFASKDLSTTASEAAGFPLARVEAGRDLPLNDGLNPAWAAAMAAFAEQVVKPLLGTRTALTEAEWHTLESRCAPYNAWSGGKAGVVVEKLGIARVRELLTGNGKDAVSALIAKDRALEGEANGVAAVEKLIRLHRDLFKLLNNFVSFSEFYGRREKAVFQAGTLYLDQRACELCVRVEDAGKHAALAGLAKSYLAYCNCERKSTGEKMTIAAAFTNGDSDNLMVGRNGVFYDRQGRDWDATITKIIDNPISIRQAFWSPYKKFLRLVEEQVAKRAAAAESASSAKLSAAAEAAANADKMKAAPATAKPADPKKVDVGTVAALGVAFGAISTFLATVFSKFVELKFWQLPLVLIGLILAISLPSMIIAWLKLRQRNLGPILDANGWAVNAPAKINIPFGASLTKVGALPAGAEHSLEADPFAEKKQPWFLYNLIAVLLVLWGLDCYFGFVQKWIEVLMGLVSGS